MQQMYANISFFTNKVKVKFAHGFLTKQQSVQVNRNTPFIAEVKKLVMLHVYENTPYSRTVARGRHLRLSVISHEELRGDEKRGKQVYLRLPAVCVCGVR